MRIDWPWTKQPKSKIVWIDLGDLGDLVHPDGPHEQWQDHGLGLLRTILHQNGIQTDLVSTRAVTSWEQLAQADRRLRDGDHERAQLHLPVGAARRRRSSKK